MEADFILATLRFKMIILKIYSSRVRYTIHFQFCQFILKFIARATDKDLLQDKTCLFNEIKTERFCASISIIELSISMISLNHVSDNVFNHIIMYFIINSQLLAMTEKFELAIDI